MIVSLCLAVCLAGLAIAHIGLRQETAELTRAVRLVRLTTSHISNPSYTIERLGSKLDDLESEVSAKVDHSDLEDLEEEVGRLTISVLDNRAQISEIPDFSDFVRDFELHGEILALEKRIKAIEETVGRRRY